MNAVSFLIYVCDAGSSLVLVEFMTMNWWTAAYTLFFWGLVG
jgi:hypothetical protein